MRYFMKSIAFPLLLMGNFSFVLAADLAQGQRLYNMHCVACHGINGVPIMPNTPNFAMRERLDKPDYLLSQSLKTGKNMCPPVMGRLKDHEIADVLQYIRVIR